MTARTPRPLEAFRRRGIRRLTEWVAVAVVGALILVACGGGAKSSAPSVGPASDLQSGSNAATFVNGSPGVPVEFLGLKVTVSMMTQGGDDSGPWLTVHVRAENAGGQPGANPNIGIVCADNEQTGGWQAASTFTVGQGLPAGSFDEGDVNLLLPGDSRTGQMVPECKTPAVVRASTTGVVPRSGGPAGGFWSIADDIVARLNATRKQ